MKIHIEAPFSVNDYTRNIIETKLEKLLKQNDRIIHIDVYLRIGDQPAPNDKVMEAVVRHPGPDITAISHTSSYEKAASEVSNKLRRQLIKLKEKRHSR